MILIGGATGRPGKEVMAQLLRGSAEAQLAVLARDARKAKAYSDQGIEVRIADFDRPATLARRIFRNRPLSRHFHHVLQPRCATTSSYRRGLCVRVKHVINTGLAMRDILTSGVRE